MLLIAAALASALPPHVELVIRTEPRGADIPVVRAVVVNGGDTKASLVDVGWGSGAGY